MKRFSYLILLLLGTTCVYGQGRWMSKAAKEVARVEPAWAGKLQASFKQGALRTAQLSADLENQIAQAQTSLWQKGLIRRETLLMEHLQREQSFEQEASFFTQEEKALSALLWNKRIKRAQAALKWFSVQAGHTVKARRLAEMVTTLVAMTPKYTELIPADTKVVFLGEMHSFNRVSEEVEKIILQHRIAYPEKNIYMLAESISGDMPVLTRPNEQAVLGMHQYMLRCWSIRALSLHLLQKGVRVGGLERPGLIRPQLLRPGGDLAPHVTHQRYSSFVMVTRRNLEFAKHINAVLEADPQALIFAYGGYSHFNYLNPGNTAELVGHPKTYTIQFAVNGKDNLSQETAVWDLWSYFNKPLHLPSNQTRVDQVKDPVKARMFGADMRISFDNKVLLESRQRAIKLFTSKK